MDGLNDSLKISTKAFTLKWPKSRTLGTPSAGEDAEGAGTLIHGQWECSRVQPLWKTVWQCLTKLNTPLPHNPLTVLLGIYPNEPETQVHTKTSTQMFTAALSITAKAWKPPRCPSVGDDK